MNKAHFILYVGDQAAAAKFYEAALVTAPVLNVPGMTEFSLPGGSILGLMPEAGVRRLFKEAIADPAGAGGIPRAELYLVVDDARLYHQRALEAGGRELSPVLERNWGHRAGYCLDPDGHVLAFAEETFGV